MQARSRLVAEPQSQQAPSHSEPEAALAEPTSTNPTNTAVTENSSHNGRDTGENKARVTWRAAALGLLFSSVLAFLNCWIETVANVHFVGGVQMPFGAIAILLFLILAVNLPLRWLNNKFPTLPAVARPLSAVELTTIYAMMLFGSLVSTPGAENMILTVGPALFYFASRENRWAEFFYNHVPSWFAPGWDGATYQRDVIEPLFLGGLSWSQIPWHAWTAMLIAWSVMFLLAYAVLFFLALLLRHQWIENEVLTFPLVSLPLQMVDMAGEDGHPPAAEFWRNRLMWAGFGLAFLVHGLRGMNNYYPDWPVIASFQGNAIGIAFPDKPWNALGGIPVEIYLGAIGIAYLLTREMSLSFWFFFLVTRFELVIADQLGFVAGTLPKGPYVPMGGRAQPTFIAFQGVGGWLMLGLLLLWVARDHIGHMVREAARTNRSLDGEPFSPRTIVLGFLLSFAALIAWSWFAGINIMFALVFFAIYVLTSLVLARLVIEGGFLFPQATYMPLEWMTVGMFGTAAIGASSLTKLSFLQAAIMTDMRTNTLPAFLHTLKMAHALNLTTRDSRRLLTAVAVAVVVALGVTLITTIATYYSNGALLCYSFSGFLGPQRVFTGATTVLRTEPPLDFMNLTWMGVGAAVVWGMMLARNRFLWFPFHPLGYIAAPGYGAMKLWFSFFAGWLIKILIMKFSGNEAYVRLRPFMIGLILGNATAMVVWMLFGFWRGSQIPYWPA